jgi:hypothetical protein
LSAPGLVASRAAFASVSAGASQIRMVRKPNEWDSVTNPHMRESIGILVDLDRHILLHLISAIPPFAESNAAEVVQHVTLH